MSGIRRLALLGLVVAAAPVSAQDASLCPMCGSGETYYFEWRCERFAWQLAVVGIAAWPECAGSPVYFGKKTDCYETVRTVGGGGEDVGQCYEFECPPPPDDACHPWNGVVPHEPPDVADPGDSDDWWDDWRDSLVSDDPPDVADPGDRNGP